jgi:Rrf2 family iron-sulfur cluster assembly transcriptional regulator
VIEMLYSKTAKYAVLALAEIARRSQDAAVPTKTIAAAAAVPYPLLAKILLQLKETGLVVAHRGKRGGIRLARPASEIAVRDVVVAVDGPGMLSDCPLYLDACTCERECSLHPIWKPARDALVRFVEGTSIQDVADARAKLAARSGEPATP